MTYSALHTVHFCMDVPNVRLLLFQDRGVVSYSCCSNFTNYVSKGQKCLTSQSGMGVGKAEA